MTGPRIPTTEGVSGTFAALERTTPLSRPTQQMFAFDGTHVRVIIDESGEPLFVAADVARALGYRDAANLVRRLDDDERGTRSVSTPGGTQDMTVITEAGMYSAVIGSQVESAKRFKTWLTHKVLPEIRRTGSYNSAPAAPAKLPSKRELAQWVIEAEERAEAAESRVRELTPSASAWNELAEAAGDYSVADAAKILSRDAAISTGERRLFKELQRFGWIFREGGRWRAMQRRVDDGRLTEKVGRPYLRDGVMQNGEPTVRITPKGLASLHQLLGGTGQLELIAAVS